MTERTIEPGADRAPPAAPARPASEHLARLARYFSPRPRRPLPAFAGNDVRLLINGNEIFSAMLSAILTARRTVDVEMYIWRADDIGQRFAELLKAKAAEGVRVRVIYDSVGCWLTPRSFWRQMARAGVRVAEFNPVARWRRRKAALRFYRWQTINHRDHRKLVVVDGQTAFIGGVNIGDEYVGEGHDPSHWRDTCVQVRGQAVARVTALFDRQWRRVTGSRMVSAPIAWPAQAGDHWAIVLDSRPRRFNMIQRTILAAVWRARKSIEITMAYFLPPPLLAFALRRAARRGVKVTLILPSRSDVPGVLYAGRSYYARLLRAGVRIHECLGTVLHAKSLQIDGLWATVGSANLDLRSFRLNDEVNLFVLGRDFAAQLHQMFLDDLARSRRIDRAEWKRRPLWDKIGEWFCRLFRFWM